MRGFEKAKIYQTIFIHQADALVSLGLADLGYTTLTIDDRYWKHTKSRVLRRLRQSFWVTDFHLSTADCSAMSLMFFSSSGDLNGILNNEN